MHVVRILTALLSQWLVKNLIVWVQISSPGLILSSPLLFDEESLFLKDW